MEADFSAKNLFRNVETRRVRTSSLQSREMFPTLKRTNQNTTIKTITMKYALLVHVNKDAVDQSKDAKAAGMAYGAALRCGHFRRRGRSGVAAGDHCWYRSETEN